MARRVIEGQIGMFDAGERGTTEVIRATRTSSVSGEAAATFPRGEGLGKPEQPSALARAVERAAAMPARPTTQQTAAEAAEGPQEAAQGGAGNASANAPEAGQAASAADVGAMYAGLSDALERMMQEAGVTPDEVRYVIAQKGIYPANTPWAVICGNDQFMKGWLMHPQVWPKVVEMAIQSREDVPF